MPRFCVGAALTLSGRPGPGPGGRLPYPHAGGLCRRTGAWGLPSVAPSKPVSDLSLPDRLRGQRSTRFARSASLVTGRLTAATAQSLAHEAGSCETASNQGLLWDARPDSSAYASGVPRSKAGTLGKYIYTFAAAHGAAVVVYGGGLVVIPDLIGDLRLPVGAGNDGVENLL